MPELDVSVEDSSAENLGTEQGVIDHINEVFKSADPLPAELDNEKSEPAPQADPPRNPAALRREAKQQKEELAEEGLEGDGVDQDQEEEDAKLDEADEEAAVDENAEPSVPEVDPALRHIANEFGWSDEKIDKLAAKDPELLNETLSSLADTYANLSRSYLNGGTQQQTASQPQQAPASQSSVSNLDALFQPQALEAFAQANGEELVEKFLKPFYNEVYKPVLEMRAQAEVAERQAVAAEANTTFGRLSEKYADIYGAGTTLTPAQLFARNQVAQTADQLRSGARMQGRELSVSEALNRAHLMVTADRRQEAGRKQVQEQVQKRSKAITAKPTQRRSTSQTLGKKTELSAVEAYERKAAELGIEI